MTHASSDPLLAKRLGAYYTPETVATTMAEWVIRTGNERLLEPSVGAGALARAAANRALAIGAGPDELRLVCCDLSADALAGLPKLDCPVELHCSDFLALSTRELGLVDAIAMNPPFTRNHSLTADRRASLKAEFDVSGAAGLWVYFLVHACRFLVRGGRMAAVVPASAVFTNYGQSALERICRSFSSVEIRRMVDMPAWVNYAEERGALLLADGFGLGRSQVPHPTSWQTSGERTADIFVGNPLFYREARLATVPLGELAKISIGAVTGHNRVFLISETERVAEGIDLDVVRPVAARARHVNGLVASADSLLELAKQGERTWLLSPKDIKKRHSSVRKRLATISRHRRLKTVWLNKRSPWWRVEVPEHCDAIFTYMNHGAPRLILAESGIACTNTLHSVCFNEGINNDVKVAAALTMISTFGQLSAELMGRVYGGGLLKFELQEVRRLPILPANPACSRANLRLVHSAWLEEGAEAARSLADEIMLSPIFGVRWREAANEMAAEMLRLRRERHQTAVTTRP